MRPSKELEDRSAVHFRLCGSSTRLGNNRGASVADVGRLLLRETPLTRMAEAQAEAEAEDCMASCHCVTRLFYFLPIDLQTTEPRAEVTW